MNLVEARQAARAIDVHVGQRLRAARMERRLSQGSLAELVGVTFQQVQKYERGTNRISPGRLGLLCHYLDKSITWFFEGLPGTATGEGDDIVARLLAMPYGRDLVLAALAIERSADRGALAAVARAMGPRIDLQQAAE